MLIQQQLTTVKSIHKGGVKEKIQENQREMFLVNTVSKIYESVLKYKARTCHYYKTLEENKDQQQIIYYL